MKTTLLTGILITSLAFTASTQTVNIPDVNFKALLVGNSAINTNSDGEIQVIEAQNFTGPILCTSMGISDLTGIEHFTSTTYLECSDNSLTSIDLSQNVALEILYCVGNQLTNLDIRYNINLTELDFSHNNITNIDLSQNTSLESLLCTHNQLTTLDISHNTNLIELDCGVNLLQNLELSQNITLQSVICRGNLFTSLDFSLNTSLDMLWCFNNQQLTELNLANGNNANLTVARTSECSNLYCVKVDDAMYSEQYWRNASGFLFDLQHLFYDDDNSCPYLASTGTTETLANNKFAVYPNPTNGIVYFSEIIDLQATNYLGQRVAEKKNVNTLDLSEQPTGIYFITLIDNQEQVLQRIKIVKE